MTLAPDDYTFALNAFRRNPLAGPDLLMERVGRDAREALKQREAYEAARKAGDYGTAQIAAENAARFYSKCHGNSAAAARSIREHRAREPGRSQP